MRFVILSYKEIPGYGVKGPILSPANYDVHLVLKWINAGIDVREVMEDGSYRKLSFNDPRLMEELHKKLDKQAKKREDVKKELENLHGERIIPRNNVQLSGEEHDKIKTQIIKKKEVVKENKPKNKKKEVIKEEPVVEQKVEEPPVELFIDELEKPE